MGLLDILNGMQNGPRGQTQPGKGGMSPITMAMLALLAYKAYQKMNAGQPGAAPARNSLPPATGNTGGGLSGGLGDILGGMLGGPRGGAAGGGLGDILKGGLGGVLGGALAGGAAGSVLNGGLGDLLKQFQQSGHADVAHSWVGTGPNKEISPDDLGDALGDDTVNSLAEQAGLSKVELLQGMSQQLPHLVDQLTPNGRLPTDEEMSRMI
jgi:uncharacterized protein YidB (DUF937 family)